MYKAKDINGKEIKVSKGLSGVYFCVDTYRELICKTNGKHKVPHFAYKSGRDWDTWSEGVSKWHSDWQDKWPIEQQEVTIKRDGIWHRADIQEPNGHIIEVQNSPINHKKINDRELFYVDMEWIFNAIDWDINITKYNYSLLKRYGTKMDWNFELPEFSWKHLSNNYNPKIPVYFEWNRQRKYVLSCTKKVSLDITEYYLSNDNNEMIENVLLELKSTFYDIFTGNLIKIYKKEYIEKVRNIRNIQKIKNIKKMIEQDRIKKYKFLITKRIKKIRYILITINKIKKYIEEEEKKRFHEQHLKTLEETIKKNKEFQLEMMKKNHINRIEETSSKMLNGINSIKNNKLKQKESIQMSKLMEEKNKQELKIIKERYLEMTMNANKPYNYRDLFDF